MTVSLIIHMTSPLITHMTVPLNTHMAAPLITHITSPLIIHMTSPLIIHMTSPLITDMTSPLMTPMTGHCPLAADIWCGRKGRAAAEARPDPLWSCGECRCPAPSASPACRTSRCCPADTRRPAASARGPSLSARCARTGWTAPPPTVRQQLLVNGYVTGPGRR